MSKQAKDDEITIDFSKIKGLFKKTKKDKKAVNKDKKKLEKDISLESKHKKELREQIDKVEQEYSDVNAEPIEDEISFDFEKSKEIFKKYSYLLLILIPIILTIMIRIQPNTLPATDDWAKSTVDNYFKNQIRTQIEKQYPNLPETNKQGLIDENYVKFYEQNKASIDSQVAGLSNQYKQYFKDEKGYTYLSDIDSYSWLKGARNIIDHGFVGDRIVDGQQIDDHMNAPLGFPTSSDIHSYTIAYLFPIMKIFDSNITLMQTSFYIPIIISVLCTIFAFLIGRRIAGNVGGFFAALILAINPMFITRTFGSDNDIWNVLFPLIIIWLFLEAFEAESMKKRLIFASLAGIVNGAYAFAWGGWWYTFDVLLGVLGVYFIYILFANYKHLKGFEFFKKPVFISFIQIAVAFVLFAGLLVTLIFSFKAFVLSPLSPLSFVTIKDAAHQNFWPNVYTTVAELNAGNFQDVLNNFGGKLFMSIAALGVILTLLKKDEHGHFNVKHAVLVFIWFAGTLYATYKGIRFIFLMIPVFSIAFGVGIGLIYYYLNKWMTRDFSVPKNVSKILILGAIVIFMIPYVRSSYDVGKGLIPTMNDPWYDALSEIKADAPKDAIINSWWDFGHWFKYIADRGVTFDGASQNGPDAHWIGRVLSTDNEDEAMRILRMLDCGQNTFFNKIDLKFNNTRKSMKIVYEVIDNEGKEKQILSNYGLSNEESEDALKYFLCSNPPQDYFIASEDMVGKAGVWAHFGSWDFERAEIWISLRHKPKQEAVKYMIEEFNYTKERAESIYDEANTIVDENYANQWIAPWPNYVTGIGECRQTGNETYICGNQIPTQSGNQYVVVNVSLKEKQAFVETQNGKLYPASFVFVKDNKTYEEKFNQSTLPFSIILIPTQDGYRNFWSQQQLANSMFTRLFFLDAAGLNHFELFTHKQGMTGTNIYVYKVNWEGINTKNNKNETKKEAK